MTAVPRPAVAGDVAQLHVLREALARWMTGAGIRQWRPGEVAPEEVAAQVAAGEWHVLRPGVRLLGALRLLEADPVVWGERRDAAAYVHGLMVDRDCAGAGLGARMLDWAARTAPAGRTLLRLDCVETNGRLRRYYRDLGFEEVGRRAFDTGWDPVVLLERRLPSR